MLQEIVIDTKVAPPFGELTVRKGALFLQEPKVIHIVSHDALEKPNASVDANVPFLACISDERADRKAELKSYLDRWQALEPSERERLRQGKAGEILAAMDAVANAIQGRHQDWFGAELPAAGAAPAKDAGSADKGGEAGDLSQMINIYRGLQ